MPAMKKTALSICTDRAAVIPYHIHKETDY